ncbi:helix-turn-helix transcriptional regulator [Streptomyces sp. NPDC056480]|uniref:helix-turn-helix transcriptional regulator n=1 Tax=Streptomyces sp. NPDC056480 TaxID=3345833 RepID=UPI0036CF5549
MTIAPETPLNLTTSAPERNMRLAEGVGEAGLTYAELAERLQVDPKTVERWVNEPGRRPYARHAHAVARILGTTVWELWPARQPQETAPQTPTVVPVPPVLLAAARDALSRVDNLDLGSASPTAMAMHLGSLSSALRTVLDLVDVSGVST